MKLSFPKLSFRNIAIGVAVLVLLATFLLALGAYLKSPPSVSSSGEEPVTTPMLPGENLRIDDFEVRAASLEAWHPMVVEGRTRVDLLITEGGAFPGSRYHLEADFVRPYQAEGADVAAVVARLADGGGRDITSFSGVEFWIDASPGTFIVQLGVAGVDDFDQFNSYVQVRERGWQQYRLPFDSFRQEGFGKPVEWTGTDLVHIGFFSLIEGSSSMAIDHVRFYED